MTPPPPGFPQLQRQEGNPPSPLPQQIQQLAQTPKSPMPMQLFLDFDTGSSDDLSTTSISTPRRVTTSPPPPFPSISMPGRAMTPPPPLLPSISTSGGGMTPPPPGFLNFNTLPTITERRPLFPPYTLDFDTRREDDLSSSWIPSISTPGEQPLLHTPSISTPG
jgi:hypothetical protein